MTGPVVAVIIGKPRGRRVASMLSSLEKMNEDRGLVVEFRLDPEYRAQLKLHPHQEAFFDEVATLNLEAVRRTVESLKKHDCWSMLGEGGMGGVGSIDPADGHFYSSPVLFAERYGAGSARIAEAIKKHMTETPQITPQEPKNKPWYTRHNGRKWNR